MIPIIDLFAGPGGLNEGFSRFGEAEGAPAFRTIGSFEMDPVACATLRLRHTYHDLLRSTEGVPEAYYEFIRGERSLADLLSDERVSESYDAASGAVHEVELGADREVSDALITAALDGAEAAGKDWVLVGGPPCQAYSLVGRSRRRKDKQFEDDKKHFLYREYLHILNTFEPPVFVMENVKGLLSSTNRGTQMFDLIRSDLESAGSNGYDLYSFVVAGRPGEFRPSDFVIHAEEYGVPQKRHRVILLGVRRGYISVDQTPRRLVASPKVSVQRALGHLPSLRSGISPLRNDSRDAWTLIRSEARALSGVDTNDNDGPSDRGGAFVRPASGSADGPFEDWITDDRLGGFIQHESRTHMPTDLHRYYYAAHFTKTESRSPKLGDFPEDLLPNHANVTDEFRPFEDRFRVQHAAEPSTTVTSHIAKDGHYYIHFDPEQMRSLTVREAARLQSFPDNYYFAGNRTQQYHQVGNAVPPLLAFQLADIVSDIFASRGDRLGEPAQADQPVHEPVLV